MTIVVAADSNWGIGYNGTQNLVLKADRKHFRELTQGSTVIVGRKTLSDFPNGLPLKNRRNVILTRDTNFTVPNGVVVHSVSEALDTVKNDERVYIIGGGSVYKAFLPYCTHAVVTKIQTNLPADTYFPNLDDLTDWTVIDRTETFTENGINYMFAEYMRIDSDNAISEQRTGKQLQLPFSTEGKSEMPSYTCLSTL